MGTPLQARDVARRGLAKAVERVEAAWLLADPTGPRSTVASLAALAQQAHDDAAGAGLNGRPVGWHLLRLGIYAHEFNQDAQLEQARARLSMEQRWKPPLAMNRQRRRRETVQMPLRYG